MKEAERWAASGNVKAALSVLRNLSFDEFSALLFQLPVPELPCLSAILPNMASEQVQKMWTGATGHSLLEQTKTFVRSIQRTFETKMNRSLSQTNILDFGCGYGRIIRLMYYFADPEHIWGVDPWDEAINICRADNVLGNLAISEYLPRALPVGNVKFDFVYAYSVFTHLSERATKTALQTLRNYVRDESLCAITIRSKEYWNVVPSLNIVSDECDINPRLRTAEHEQTGFTFVPHLRERVDGDLTYGECSFTLEWLRKQAPEWQVMCGGESATGDRYQMMVYLMPR